MLRVLQQMNKLIKTEAAVNCCTIAPCRRPRRPRCSCPRAGNVNAEDMKLMQQLDKRTTAAAVAAGHEQPRQDKGKAT